MQAAFKVNVQPFNRMCREISSLTGARFQDVVQYEAAKVLEGAAGKTKAASVQSIKQADERLQFKACPVDMYTPVGNVDTARGSTVNVFGSARREMTGFVVYYLGNRYPALLWKLIQDKRARGIKVKIGARGLSKKSWYDLAKTFGLEIKIPAYAKKAKPSNGKQYTGNVRSERRGSGGTFVLHVINAQPTVNTSGAGGRSAIGAAIAGRVRYFRTNVSKQVFKSAAAIAKRYPGIKVAT